MFSKFTDVNSHSGKEKKTKLITAIEKNNLKVFQKLVTNPGIDIDKGDIYGRTPLMYAFFNGRIEYVNILLQKGANLNIAEASGRTLLYYYAESVNTEVVKALVSIGANIDDYNCIKQNHCLNIMPNNMLQALFSTARPGEVLKALRNNLVSNTVRRSFIAYLIGMQQWERLVMLCQQLPGNASDLRIMACEALPTGFLNNQILNTFLLDCVAEEKEELAIELIIKGAGIDQKNEKGVHILKLFSPAILGEAFARWAKDIAVALVNPANDLAGSEVSGLFADYLTERKEYEKIKDIFYASLKYSKQQDIGKLLMKLLVSLPEQETDHKMMQAVFRYAGRSLAGKFISEGFDCNFSSYNGRHVLFEVEESVRELIFKHVPPEFILMVFKASSKNAEEAKLTNNIAEAYGAFLTSVKNWEVLKSLIRCDFVERSRKATMYERLPEDIRDDVLKDYLQRLFPERLTAFDEIPSGLLSFSNGEVIACVKNNIDSKYDLSIIAGKLEPDGYAIQDQWESCSVCNGTGIVGNFDAALDRDCYSYGCGFCNGKGKVRTNLIVYKDKKVIWRK